MVDIVQAKGQKSKSVRQEKSVVMTYDKFMNDTEEASVLLTLYSLVLYRTVLSVIRLYMCDIAIVFGRS